MKKIFILFFILIVSDSFSLKAQIGHTQNDGPKIDSLNKITERFASKTFSPFGKSSLSNFISSFSLTSAYNEGENGKIELKHSKNWWTYGLSVDQAISKNDKESTPLDLDGLNSGTTVGFNLQKIFWNPAVTKNDFDNFQQAKNRFVRQNKIIDPREITVSEILNDSIEKNRFELKLKHPWFFNITGSFNKTEYNYTTDSVGLTKIGREYLVPSFKISAGAPYFKNNELKSFFAISYIYSANYSVGNTLTFITPFSTRGNYISKTLVFGAPLRKTDNRINMEWRTTIGEESQNFGIAPSLTYGIDSKKLGVSLPVYIIKGSSKDKKPLGLQGGFRLSYTTDTRNGVLTSIENGLVAQVIITAPFDVLGSFNK